MLLKQCAAIFNFKKTFFSRQFQRGQIKLIWPFRVQYDNPVFKVIGMHDSSSIKMWAACFEGKIGLDEVIKLAREGGKNYNYSKNHAKNNYSFILLCINIL